VQSVCDCFMNMNGVNRTGSIDPFNKTDIRTSTMERIIINVIIALLIFVLSTYMNIRTKTGKDQKVGMPYYKSTALNIILAVCCGWAAYALFIDLSSSDPLDRVSLVIILINFLSLFYLFITWQLQRLLSMAEKMIQKD
jgi:hypothetical protein